MAQKHYLKPTEADFEKSLGSKTDLQIDQHDTEEVSRENQTYQLNLKNTAMPVGAAACDTAEIEKHAQQDSHIDSETTENTESTGNGSSSNRSQDLNLDQIKSILASIDPTSLKQLLVEILKE